METVKFEMPVYNFQIFPDYYQFYIQDETSDRSLSEDWTEENVTNQLVVGNDVIVVGTESNMNDVPVVVEVREQRPTRDFSAWDRVNKCSISVPSGTLVVTGCTDYFPHAARITVSPGTYRALILYGNLDDAWGDNPTDHYEVVFWPDEPCPTQMLKARHKEK